MNKQLSKYMAVMLITGISTANRLKAQQITTITLRQALEAAQKNNNFIHIKELKVKEKDAKIKESNVKLYPSLTLNAAYQYNAETGQLTVPAGSFGTLPFNQTTIIPLPADNKSFALSKHNNLNVGLTAYQPILQLGRIKTAIAIAKTDRAISAWEQWKSEWQISNAVEQYYYGILAVRKRKMAAEKNIEAAKMKLYDVQSALLSGKTTGVSEAALNADVAHEEQELLKHQFQEEDYISEFIKLTGINDGQIALSDSIAAIPLSKTLAEYQSLSKTNNPDLQIAQLQKQKSELGMIAARQSFLPDFGVFAGYAYQNGNAISPKNNPYAGVSLKWNIQDIFSNTEIVSQRYFIMQQAEQNQDYTEKETSVSIERTYRRVKQALELILVAQKVVNYRKADLKLKKDQRKTGLGKPLDVLETEAALAKSEADLYEAMTGYNVAFAELKMLTENLK